jgi:hypothetical protein
LLIVVFLKSCIANARWLSRISFAIEQRELREHAWFDRIGASMVDAHVSKSFSEASK